MSDHVVYAHFNSLLVTKINSRNEQLNAINFLKNIAYVRDSNYYNKNSGNWKTIYPEMGHRINNPM